MLAASAGAATVIHFQSEGLPALQAQLHKHEVHALTFHPTPAPGHMHVSMDDGRHFTVVYTTVGEQAQLVDAGTRERRALRGRDGQTESGRQPRRITRCATSRAGS